MMTWKIRYTDKARRDLRNIMEYVSYDLLEPETAKNLLRRIMGEIETLDTMPLRYPLFHEEPWRGAGPSVFRRGKLSGVLCPGRKQQHGLYRPRDLRRPGHSGAATIRKLNRIQQATPPRFTPTPGQHHTGLGLFLAHIALPIRKMP